MQPGQAAGGQAPAGGGGPQPGLPARRDLVVAHVRRVAQEEGGASGRRKAQRPVVTERDARPAGHARRGEGCPADHRGKRVGLGPHQGGTRPAAAGGDEEPGRTGPRVNHPGRGERAGGPADHAPHHRPGGEGLAGRPPLRRPAQATERLPQWVLTGQDQAPGVRDLIRSRPAAGGGEALLRARPSRHLGGSQPHRRAGQRVFRLEGDHGAHCDGTARARRAGAWAGARGRGRFLAGIQVTLRIRG